MSGGMLDGILTCILPPRFLYETSWKCSRQIMNITISSLTAIRFATVTLICSRNYTVDEVMQVLYMRLLRLINLRIKNVIYQ